MSWIWRSIVQQDLSDKCINSDLLNTSINAFPISSGSRYPLHDIRTFIHFHYHIILGRRNNISDEVRRRMNQYRSIGDIEVGTYDRFVDIAENFDKYYENPNESIYLPVTEG